MARLWTCGFENQSVTNGIEVSSPTAFVGSPTINTSTHREGAASVRFNPSGAAWFMEHQYATATGGRRVFFRAYIYIASMPTSDTIIMANTDGSGRTPRLFLQTTGKLRLAEGSAGTHTFKGTESAVLSTNTWYRVEMDYNGPSADATTAYLDGVDFSGSIAGGTGFDTTGMFRFGAFTSTGNTTADIYFDDVCVNDSTGGTQNSLPGAGSVAHLRPNAAGDNNGFATAVGGTAGAANNFTRVNQVTPDDATSYNNTTATGTTTIDDFNLDSSASASITGTVKLVQVGGRVGSSATTTANIVYRIKSQAAGTTVESASVNVDLNGWTTHIDNAVSPYQLTSYVDPQAGGAWTTALLDTAQIGYRGNVSQTTQRRISQLWLLVEFSPATDVPIAGTDTASGAEAEASVALNGTETSSGADSEAVAATLPGTDTGLGTESHTLAVTLSDTDTASGTETESASVPSSDSDASGAGAETQSIAATLSDTDTGTGTETSSLAATLAGTETVTSTDSETFVVSIFSEDGVVGFDIHSLDKNTPPFVLGDFGNTLVQGPGSIYIAEFGAVEPADGAVDDLPDSGVWTDLGGVVGGVELVVEQEWETINFMQIPEPVLRRLKKRKLTVKTQLSEPTLANLAYILNEELPVGSVFEPSADRTDGDILPYKALLIRGWSPGVDENTRQHLRRTVILRKSLSIDNIEVNYHKEDQTTYTVSWACHYVDEAITPFKVIDEA